MEACKLQRARLRVFPLAPLHVALRVFVVGRVNVSKDGRRLQAGDVPVLPNAAGVRLRVLPVALPLKPVLCGGRAQPNHLRKVSLVALVVAPQVRTRVRLAVAVRLHKVAVLLLLQVVNPVLVALMPVKLSAKLQDNPHLPPALVKLVLNRLVRLPRPLVAQKAVVAQQVPLREQVLVPPLVALPLVPVGVAPPAPVVRRVRVRGQLVEPLKRAQRRRPHKAVAPVVIARLALRLMRPPVKPVRQPHYVGTLRRRNVHPALLPQLLVALDAVRPPLMPPPVNKLLRQMAA